jgi:competence protein ComEC
VRASPLSLPLLLAIAGLVVVALARSDEIRERAEAGLGRGMPVREAALARGFVLGQDEGIDEVTREDFRRAGLGHLLAVSGQNIVLLALLATPLLAALGIPLRERLVWLLGLIAVYVPLAGAGPSIQRAAVMGAAGLVATMAGRPASRLYALLLALLVTLAVDPGVAGDVGWQLSFAAVAGIFALASSLRGAIASRLGRGRWRLALAEGTAVTVAATLATAPLIAFHFGTVSTTTLLANLLAMPAVAPAMWLGMLTAAASQVPGAPVEAINAVDAHLLAYVAQVAIWCGRPSWAEIEVRLGLGGALVSYLAMAGGAVLSVRIARHRRLGRLRRQSRPPGPRGPAGHLGGGRPGVAPAAAAVAIAAVALVAAQYLGSRQAGAVIDGPPASGLRIAVLDVGQGDAILLQPARSLAILVDAGPPGEDLVAKLRGAGVERLAAAVVTHDESDHAGGIEELLGDLPVGRLLYARLGGELRAGAKAVGAVPARVVAGDVVRSGRLRLEALWPPGEMLSAPLGAEDPNGQALVLLVRWGRFSMLLAADAEAEAVPLDPGPLDVLKVAHHGSDDAGLGDLLDRTRPRFAVISSGAGNPFGHPTPGTLATLAAHGVHTMRTDLDGTIEIEVDAGNTLVRWPRR